MLSSFFEDFGNIIGQRVTLKPIPPQSRHSCLLNNYSQNDKSGKEDLVDLI